MHKKLLACILLSLQLCNVLYAKQKGFEAASSKKLRPAKTWAVVAGISKYENIRGLNFADKDAQAFYNYLVNTDGGPRLKPGQVKLLLNEKALSTEIYGALDWLKESVKPNDRVIFYFSGHGDVEKKGDSQEGYLLAYNSPKAAYATSGTVGVKYLQQYLDRYISQNKAQCVILIADACRAGKLAGTNEGAQLTTQSLGRNKNKQIIKILSAQENEVSFEGSKWGGGVFTYYLLKGIEGLANANSDNVITTSELAAYLPLKVAFATANAQHPQIDGNPSLPLFTFNANRLKVASEEKSESVLPGGSLGTGIAENIPPDIKKMYQKYLNCLQQQNLIPGDRPTDTSDCAKLIYLKLINNPRAEAIQSSLKASFIAALQQNTQEALDHYVKGGAIDFYGSGEILYLQTLIKPGQVLYNYIMARACFIQSQIVADKKQYIPLLLKTLKYEDDAPYALNELGVAYTDSGMADSAIYYLKKNIAVAPRWPVPYLSLGLAYQSNNNFDMAIVFFRKAIQIDSSFSEAYNNIAVVYQRLNDFDKALAYNLSALHFAGTKDLREQKATLPVYYCALGIDYSRLQNYDKAIIYCKKAIEIDSSFANGFFNLGAAWQATGANVKAITCYKKAVQLDSTLIKAYINEGIIYQSVNDYPNALVNFRKAIQVDSTDSNAYILLGYSYIVNNKKPEGILLLQKALKLNPTEQVSYYNLACAWCKANDNISALNCLKEAIDKGLSNYNQIMQDDDLANLRKTPEFNQLMKHYFPHR
jgi:tetratricopeptide (TPR) repeat protein